MRITISFLLIALALPAMAETQGQGGVVPAVTPELARTDYDMEELARAPDLSTSELNGRRLFAQNCALCHDPVGQPTRGDTYGPVINHDFLDALGEPQARKAITKGTERMPGFQYHFRGTDLDDVIAFIKTMSATPAASQTDAKSKSAAPVPLAELGAPVAGTVQSAAGDPMAGVAVSARAHGKTFTTTVYTDEKGAYAFPALDRGRYNLLAQAVGYEAARAQVAVAATSPQPPVLKLRPNKDVESTLQQLSSAEWLDTLPGETREDRRIREVFRLHCGECHALNLALQRRFDEKGWVAIVQFMRQGDYGGWMGPSGDGGHTDPENVGFGPIIEFHADELVAYLTRVRGPNSESLEPKILPRPTGAAAKVVITGYDIPPSETPHELAWHDGAEWSQGAATGMHGAGGMHDVDIDRNGNAWLTESLFNDARTITKVDAVTGQVTGWGLPAPDGIPWKADITHGIDTDADGIVWFGELGKLGRIDPTTETFQTFQTPTPPSLLTLFNETAEAMGGAMMQVSNYLLGTIDNDAKGKIWGTAFLGIWRFDPDTNEFRYYHDLSLPAQDPPPPERFSLLFTYGVAGDANGNGWWTTPHDERVVFADVKANTVQEIVMRPPWYAEEESLSTPKDRGFIQTLGKTSWHGIRPGAQYPRRLGLDKHGTTAWVPNWWGRNLAKIDVNTKEVTYYKLPINAHPYFTKVDKNHIVWTNLTMDDRVVSFDPASEEWTVYNLPINGCESRHITVDDWTGDVWVPCYRGSKVFRIQFREP